MLQFKESPSRRGVLSGVLALLAGSALPGQAFASDLKDGPLEAELSRLARPRIDRSLSAEMITAFSERVGFLVREVTVPLHNRISLETVRLVYGENGEFAWDWQMASGGRVPFLHCHRDEQEEILLTQGSLSCDLEGEREPITVTVEDAPVPFVIPKDTFHQPFNQGDETAAGIVYFENPEESAPVCTAYWNMCEDDMIEKRHGKPNFLKLLAITGGVEHSRTNVPVVPGILQDFARRVSSCIGMSQEELFAEFSER